MNLFSQIISVFPLLDALPSVPEGKPSLMPPGPRAAFRRAAEAWIHAALLREGSALHRAFLAYGYRGRADMAEVILELYDQHREGEGN